MSSRDDDRASTIRGLLRRVDVARFELDDAETSERKATERVAAARAELDRLQRAIEALREPPPDAATRAS